MQHNVTLGGPEDADADVAEGAEPTHPSDLLYMYTYGLRDIFSVFFYCLIAIVLHAILQEYVLDVSISYMKMVCDNNTMYIYQTILDSYDTHPNQTTSI